MKQTKTTKIALVSLLTALSVVLGYYLKIATPTGMLTSWMPVFSLLPFTLAVKKEPSLEG